MYTSTYCIQSEIHLLEKSKVNLKVTLLHTILDNLIFYMKKVASHQSFKQPIGTTYTPSSL